MKKVLLAIAVYIGISAGALAQGEVTFSNSSPADNLNAKCQVALGILGAGALMTRRLKSR